MTKKSKRPRSRRTRIVSGKNRLPTEFDYEIDEEVIASSTGFEKDAANIASGLAAEYNFWEAVIVTLDIRKSSIALLNVEDFDEYSDILTNYVCYAADYCRNTLCLGKDDQVIENGWFDKFTGDGVLLFWRLPLQPRPGEGNKRYWDDYYYRWHLKIKHAIQFSITVIAQFLEIALPDFRKTCGLVPTDFGISAGIDAGECLLTDMTATKRLADYYRGEKKPQAHGDGEGRPSISQNVTAIGRAVIGAHRMVSAASAYEILVNSYPGAALKARLDTPKDKIGQGVDFDLEHVSRCTKEYNPVEAYRVLSGRIDQLKAKMTLLNEVEDAPEPKGAQVKNKKKASRTTRAGRKHP